MFGILSFSTEVIFGVIAFLTLLVLVIGWNKLSGKKFRHIFARVFIIIFIQIFILASIGIGLNRYGEFYASWGELFGTKSNLAAIATGALSAIGPVVLAIGSGVILSASPDYLEGLESLAPKRRSASVRRSRLMLEELLARFIGRHILLGAVYGVVVYVGASLAGADGVLAGTLGGLVMAIPTLGQGPALLPPLTLALVAAGSYALVGIAVIVVAWLFCATWLAPRLLDSALRLPASTVFLAGTAGGIVGGPLGAIFSLPIVAAIASARRPRR